ncbi:MAG TPA: META domain-containing protein, partial [Gemmatimonadales bacterium]|nr:META domain-containing protein [Gemmatimonadales bacterium]
PTSAATLLGPWHVVSDNALGTGFDFRPDSTVTWQLGAPSELRYAFDPAPDPAHLDITGFPGGPLKGRTLYCVVKFSTPDRFRMDCEPGEDPAARPHGFDAAQTEEFARGPVPATDRLMHTAWRAEHVRGIGRLTARDTVTLDFMPGAHVAGASGCNRYFGGVTADDSTMHFGGIGGTKMACAAPRMRLETSWLDALARTARWRLAGDTLTLADSAGTELARLVRQLR